MGPSKCVAFIIIFEFLTTLIACLSVIPERATVDYLNPKFVKDVDFSVVRYGRRGKYYINLSGTPMQTWANNVTINFVFFEFRSNDYRRSFVEMHFKLCDMVNSVNSDPYIGKLLHNAGLTCPVTPGKWALKNMTLPKSEMVWPFKKCRVDFELVTSGGESICRAAIYLLFVEDSGNTAD